MKKKIKQLDTYFAKYIRKRDANKSCIYCGKPIKDAEACHFIPRINMATRYHENNVNGGCFECNREDDRNKIRKQMIKRYGLGEVCKLTAKKHEQKKYFEFEIDELIKLYKSKL